VGLPPLTLIRRKRPGLPLALSNQFTFTIDDVIRSKLYVQRKYYYNTKLGRDGESTRDLQAEKRGNILDAIRIRIGKTPGFG
jgi:hypothetical protein